MKPYPMGNEGMGSESWTSARDKSWQQPITPLPNQILAQNSAHAQAHTDVGMQLAFFFSFNFYKRKKEKSFFRCFILFSLIPTQPLLSVLPPPSPHSQLPGFRPPFGQARATRRMGGKDGEAHHEHADGSIFETPKNSNLSFFQILHGCEFCSSHRCRHQES